MQTARDRNPRPHRSWGAAGDRPGAAGVVAQPAPSRSVPRHHHQGRQAARTAGAFGLAGTGWAQLVLKNQAAPSAAHLLFTACSTLCLRASHTSCQSASSPLPLLSPRFQRKGEMAAPSFLANHPSTKSP